MPSDNILPDASEAARRPRVLFRADAGPSMGGGHAMRCLSLAAELGRRGAVAGFVSTPGTIDHVPALARAGLAVIAPDRPLPGCDVLVVDHYGLADGDERRLATATGARQVLAVDDLAGRAHACSLVLDMSFGRDPAAYDGLVPSGARVLAGSAFALLRPEFSAARPNALARRRTGGVRRILVSLGLTDVGGITLRVVEALLKAARSVPDLEVLDVVLGGRAASLAPLRAAAARDPRLRLHVDPDGMAALMAGADLAIGAGGTTSWERCCLGLPSLVVVLAENQSATARSLAQAGAAIVVDEADLESGLGEGVAALSCCPETRHAMAIAAAGICDGAGGARVADAVMAGAPAGEAAIGFRPAASDDGDRVWRWRNDPLTRASSRGPEPVPWPAHQAWLGARLADRATSLLVAEYEGEAVGTVRFDPPRPDGAREISLTLAPESRGKRLGARVLAGACRRLRAQGSADPLVGWIRVTNAASHRAFHRAGFTEAARQEGWVAMTLARGAWPSAGPFSRHDVERIAS